MRFIDLQINGYKGVDFNRTDLSAESIHSAAKAFKKTNVEGILATMISAPLPALHTCLAQWAIFAKHDSLVRQIVWGIHLEGPF